jgi:glutamyl-Q tRNA(Asp) synthetase
VSGARSSSATATTGIAEPPGSGYRGRFAPSPSGTLHFGSLVAAVGSFLEARTRGGQWLVRIEDLDPPRVRPGAADAILRCLERLQLHWDGAVLRQSERTEAYLDAQQRLQAADLLLPCQCSRTRLESVPENRGRPAAEELFHPPGCALATVSAGPPAWRFRAPDRDVAFLDRVQGAQIENVARSCGPFVVRRRDGLFAYQLAVVVDDAAQGITDVVRGVDLLGSTARQILLQEALGLPRPTYMHLPLAVDASGVKLSKSDDAPAVVDLAPAGLIVATLEFLRQSPPGDLAQAGLEAVWTWALAHWQPRRFEALRIAPVPAASDRDAWARMEISG